MLIKDSFIYLVGNIVNSILSIMMIPILTRYLSVYEYGRIGLFLGYVALFKVLVGLSCATIVNRFYFERRNLVGMSISINLYSFLAVLACSYLIDRLEIYNIEYIAYAAIVVAFLSFYFQILQGQLQMRGCSIRYSALQIGNNFLLVLITYILVSYVFRSAESRVISAVLTGSIIAIYAYILMKKLGYLELKSGKARGDVKEVLTLSFPVVLHGLAGFIISYFDRFYIELEFDTESLGLYFMAAQYISIVHLFYDSFNKGYLPWFYKKLNEGDAQRNKISIVKFSFFFLVVMFCALLYIFSEFLILTLSDMRYKESSDLFKILIVGALFQGLYIYNVNYIFYFKDTYLLPIITSVSGGVLVSLTIALSKTYGIYGVCYAVALSFMAKFLLSLIICRLRYPSAYV